MIEKFYASKEKQKIYSDARGPQVLTNRENFSQKLQTTFSYRNAAKLLLMKEPKVET